MADGFLTSSGSGKSPGRGRKAGGGSRIPKMQKSPKKDSVVKAKEAQEKKISKGQRNGKNLGRKIEESSTIIPDEVKNSRGRGTRRVEEIVEEVEIPVGRKIEEKSMKIPEQVKNSRGRGGKKAEEIVQEVEIPVGRKRGRERKTEEETKRKRMKRDDSAESSAGVESQEVRRILREVEDDRARVEERKKKIEEVVESPSRAVRSRSLMGEHIAHCVLFTGIQHTHKDLVTALGGTATDDPLNATILVTDKVRRTFKFFCAVSRGIPIVSITWLESSMISSKFLDPEKFILQDPATEAKYKFNLVRSLARAREGKLLEGRTIVLTSMLSGPSIPELKTMVQTAGGRALLRAPSVWPNDSVIVSCPEDLPKVKKMIAKAINVRVYVVDIEFLLSGLLRQELSYDEFTLKV